MKVIFITAIKHKRTKQISFAPPAPGTVISRDPHIEEEAWVNHQDRELQSTVWVPDHHQNTKDHNSQHFHPKPEADTERQN